MVKPGCENFDGVSANEYERVPHFSNLDVEYPGNSTASAGSAGSAGGMRHGRIAYSDCRGPKAVSSTAVTEFPDILDFVESFLIGYQLETDATGRELIGEIRS